MFRHILSIVVAFLCACLTLLLGQVRAAELPSYSPHEVQQLASADSKDAVPPGTVVNAGNWTQYEKFMPPGMRALWGGQYFFAVPANGVMKIGPTVHIRLPREDLLNTEKYSKDTKLVKMPDPYGYTISGYVAGVPFPNPQPPDLGYKVLYNRFYEYTGFVMKFTASEHEVDSYNNTYSETALVVQTQLNFRSVPGLPIADPVLGKNFQYALYSEVLAPEQSKYTSVVSMYSVDPSRIAEDYVFLPSLRRALRLSASAVCSPILGSDYTYEDSNDGFGGQPPLFSVDLLGQKKILAMTNVQSPGFETWDAYIPPMGWPKPQVGNWELRDAYAIFVKRLPGFSRGYCFGGKMLYVDKETWTPLEVDSYDPNMKLWKVELNMMRQTPIPESPGDVFLSNINGYYPLYDLQNRHASLSLETEPMIDQVAGKYTDVERYATPAGLQQVMK